ncbi:hypothetical protein JCM17380_15500 [Desulfosporosinus burensis]
MASCTENEAIEAWKQFFNHDYWSDLLIEDSQILEKSSYSSLEQRYAYDETEEFIENMFPVELKYVLRIDCKVTQAGWRENLLKTMLRMSEPLRTNKQLNFFVVSNTVPSPYQVYWKVRNCGEVAEQKNNLRGQIVKDNGKEIKHEETHFRGEHFVECYIIKNGVCMARDRIDVPISTL